MKIFFIGDVGEYNQVTKNIFNNIKNIKSEKVIVLLGDNFYPGGINSIDDSKLNNFINLELNCPVYSVLGNHDYLGNPKCQLQFKNNNWNLPNYYYKKTIEYIDLFFIDTSIILPNYSNLNYYLVKSKIDKDPLEYSNEMLNWLDTELEKSLNLKIVIGHYPISSYGMYGLNKQLFLKLFPYFIKHNVKYYVSGHDHNLQILDIFTNDFKMKQIISGGGSHLYPILKNCSDKVFSQLGSVCLDTNNKNITIFDSNLNILFNENLI